MSDVQPVPFKWTQRRIFLYLVTLFCMGGDAYILWKGVDTRVAETFVSFSMLCMIGSVGSYVFGAAWQDVSQLKMAGGGYANGYSSAGLYGTRGLPYDVRREQVLARRAATRGDPEEVASRPLRPGETA